jgi:phosphoribosylamine--glycine ligase
MVQRILVIGSGGREHALTWRLRQESPAAEIFVAPGNPGTERIAENVPIAVDQLEALAGFAEERTVDLTVVGPEAPLAAGVADLFRSRGLPVFGPGRAAAQIESSKAFAKDLMARADIPTAAHRTFVDDFDAAERYIRERGAPIVVKASGLAAGKGSIVCETVEDAVDAARAMIVDSRFGDAGATVVVEDLLEGEELSVLAITDGRDAVPLLPSQDHKPIGEGDTGPNTGGMGAYAPVSIADDELVGQAMDRVLLPALHALRTADREYRGVLYSGLIVTDGRPHVIEFNCRFGDPEAQAILPLLDDSLLELMARVAGGDRLGAHEVRTRSGAAVCTVLASGGYPVDYEKGKTIEIPDELEGNDDVLVFHAGTRREPDGRLVTDGGRVLSVVGLGPTVSAAAERSRAGAEAIEFEDRYFRRDIAHRETARERAASD